MLGFAFLGISAFLGKSCQGDRIQTQGWRSFLITARLPTKTGGQMQTVVLLCALVQEWLKECGTYAAMHRFYHNFSTNKQNCEGEGSAVIVTEVKESD